MEQGEEEEVNDLKQRLAEFLSRRTTIQTAPVQLLRDCRTALEQQEQELKDRIPGDIQAFLNRLNENDQEITSLRHQLLERDAALASYWSFIMGMHYDEVGHLDAWPSYKSWQETISTDAGKSMLERLQKAEAELLAIQQEEVRRIRHLNRLGTWAQQDATGPIIKDQIQAWVLAELKAALGSAYEPTSWQPETAIAEQDRLQAGGLR